MRMASQTHRGQLERLYYAAREVQNTFLSLHLKVRARARLNAAPRHTSPLPLLSHAPAPPAPVPRATLTLHALRRLFPAGHYTSQRAHYPAVPNSSYSAHKSRPRNSVPNPRYPPALCNNSVCRRNNSVHQLGAQPGAQPGTQLGAQLGSTCLLYTSPSPRDS